MFVVVRAESAACLPSDPVATALARSFKALSLGSLASCLLNSGRALSGQLRFWDDSEPVVVSDGIVRMPKLVRAPFVDRRLLTDAETLVV